MEFSLLNATSKGGCNTVTHRSICTFIGRFGIKTFGKEYRVYELKNLLRRVRQELVVFAGGQAKAIANAKIAQQRLYFGSV